MGKIANQRKSRPEARPANAEQVAFVSGRGEWRRHGWRLLATWGLILIAYSNSPQSGLVFDNASIIGRDPRIRQATSQNIGAIVAGGYRYSNPADGLYRPLTTLTYLVNYAVFGDGTQPADYHWVNLAIHAVNVALVYALGIVILGETTPAWALAAIWGLHPVLTESVSNIVGRADLLAAFGVLAGLLCYVMGASAAARRKFAWWAGVAGAQAIGLFSKESAIVLPALMLLYDLTYSGRLPSAERPLLSTQHSALSTFDSWRSRIPAYAALALPAAAFFLLRARVHPHMVVTFAENPMIHAGFWTARMTAVHVMGKLLWLFVWPARLSADYSYNAIPLFGGGPRWEDVKAIVALAACLGGATTALLLVWHRRLGKPVLFFLLFFFVAFAPTSNLLLLIGSIMAERFLYLPSVGLAGLLVAAVVAAGRRFSWPGPAAARVAWAAMGLVCLGLAARTYARNADWKDEVSLWTSATEICPNSGKAHYNLGQALQHVPGRLNDAIVQYREALRIDPSDAEAHTNLGNALAAEPDTLPEAMAEYQAALRLNPDRAEPHNDLGNALSSIPGRLPDAISEYRTALRIQPGNAEMHYNLANALARVPGRVQEAIAEYQAALRIDPGHADAHANLAKALSSMEGRLPDAIAEYRAALRVDPRLANVHINLANALLRTSGGLPEAIAEYRAAVRLQPGNAAAHFNLAIALERMSGQLPAAIDEYRAALQIAPGFMEAHVNLANALAQMPGLRSEAIAEYEAALQIRPDPEIRQMLERLRSQR